LSKTRRSNSDDLIEARAEITRLKAENEKLRVVIASAAYSNGLIETLVKDMIGKLEATFPALTSLVADRPDQPHS